MKKQYFLTVYNNRDHYDLVTVRVSEKEFFRCLACNAYCTIKHETNSPDTVVLTAELGNMFLEDIKVIK
jgi:Pyruvate/2-oxoacid:ferredoxin oxidoreductase delta subunit